MKTKQRVGDEGFTIVELVVVIVVVAILAAICIAVYSGMRKNAAKTTIITTLSSAMKLSEVEALSKGTKVAKLPDGIQIPNGVTISLVADNGPHYSNLSDVQNGVLFYSVCLELVGDSHYSVIHSRDGAAKSSVVMSCDDNIRAGGLQITGWETRNWTTPVTQQQINGYIAGVPYDSWWIDRQSVIRGFYEELSKRFAARGGTWPVNSFWDPWANQWSGVKKEELPPPDPAGTSTYCIQGGHREYSDLVYSMSDLDATPHEGAC